MVDPSATSPVTTRYFPGPSGISHQELPLDISVNDHFLLDRSCTNFFNKITYDPFGPYVLNTGDQSQKLVTSIEAIWLGLRLKASRSV